MNTNHIHARGHRDCILHPLSLAVAQALLVLGAGGGVGGAQAAPQGGTVVAGQAGITQAGAQTTVRQSSQRAVIDWRSFDVGTGERVRFEQPNAQAATLNRVTGEQASRIQGRVDANGQVFLVNPNGIVFGRGAQVNVGSLLATTQNTRNEGFMAGELRFDQPGRPGARVVNEGQITVADGGFAALVGQHVANSGSITARLGKVSLAAGEAFLLDLYGDQLVNLMIEPSQLAHITDASGQSLAASVDLSGQITAEGGRVQLSAATVRALLDKVINVSGAVRATGYAQHAGGITLTGDAGTTLAVARSATLDAGAQASSQGGAPAGDVTLVSQGDAEFAGTIRGRKVEVSGHRQLAFTGDVHADHLLIDPANLTVARTGASSLPAAGSTGDSVIAAETVNRQLRNGTSVHLQADQNLSINAQIDARGGDTGGAGLTLEATQGDLAINAPIVLVGQGGLQATAGGRITQAAGKLVVADAGAISLNGAQGVQADHLVTTGAIDLRSAQGGVSASGLYGLSGGQVADATRVDVHAQGAISLGSVASAGAITIEGSAANTGATSITLTDGAVLRARTGAVTLRASGDIRLAGSAPAESTATRGGIEAGGGITLTSSAGGIDTAAGLLQTEGHTIKLDAAQLVSVGQVVARNVGSTQAGSGVLDITSRNGDVVLTQALGGANTGYRYLGEGYLESLRPDVGRVLISAPKGSVETNGLNLDGNADPSIDANSDTVTTPGLSITAAHRIIVNEQIAVNKGAIQLSTTGTANDDTILLGNNVYQRGYDPKEGLFSYELGPLFNYDQALERAVEVADRVARWANPNKKTYLIGMSTNYVTLWDNSNNALAVLNPSGNVQMNVGKLIIANNVANYRCNPAASDCAAADSVLVGRSRVVETDANRFQNQDETGQLLRPEDRPSASVFITGIRGSSATIRGLNWLAGSRLTLSDAAATRRYVALSEVQFKGFQSDGSPLTGSGLILKVLVNEIQFGGNPDPYDELTGYGAILNSPSGANDPVCTQRTQQCEDEISAGQSTYFNNGSSFEDRIEVVVQRVNGQAVPGVILGGVRSDPTLGGQVVSLGAKAWGEDPSVRRQQGTRIVFFDLPLMHGSGHAQVDGGAKYGPSPNVGANNSSVNFSAIGSFGGWAGAAVPAMDMVSTSIDAHQQPLTLFGKPASSSVDELAQLVWPSRDADLGRGVASGGYAINPFARQYRLATNANTAVCAPGELSSSSSSQVTSTKEGEAACPR